MLLRRFDRSFCSISWKVELMGLMNLIQFHMMAEVILSLHSLDKSLASKGVPKTSPATKFAIIQLELCFSLNLLFFLYSDGQLLSCSISKKRLKHLVLLKLRRG